MPVVASNRIGKEVFDGSSITFYGGSFISGQRGEVLQQVGAAAKALAHGNLDPAPERVEGFVVQEFDLDKLRVERLGCAGRGGLLAGGGSGRGSRSDICASCLVSRMARLLTTKKS